MRIIVNVTIVCVLACVLAGIRECVCDDVEKSEESGDLPEARSDEDRKDGKNITGAVRRTTLSPNSNTTRDSQLLSLLAARRRQLLNGRLATHINTLASLAHKNKNTTFAQLEVRDVNSSIVKRITFENSSNDFAPSLKLVTTDGNKEVKQDVKPHEIRHLFVPKVYQDIRNRAGFINNRKKEPVLDPKITGVNQENVTENAILYIPPDKLENLEKGVEFDPDEEFQVDESNHGLTYLLNYSDTDNVTQSSGLNQTTPARETKENVTKIDLTTTTSTAAAVTTSQINSEPRLSPNKDVFSTTTTTETSTKLVKVENEKDKTNTTLFMSDELYNHFRPLETELPAEDMAPFLYFGQKLGGQINDNLTFSPTLSASTKSVNFIVSPPEKRKFNSRYSATEKYKNSSVMEEEVNEDMDVSVVKNVIEKNKVRNTVKGPAPARTVGLVNAYRKYSTTSGTTKSPNVAQLNATEPIISVTPGNGDKNKENFNNTSKIRNILGQTNNTLTNSEKTQNKTDIATRNYTRTYQNVRRRPARITAGSSTENFIFLVNTTTEKTSTLVYTAVVTSVSITSSVRGQNKTDGLNKDTDNITLSKITEPTDLKENFTLTPSTKLPEITLSSTTTTTTIAPSSTQRGYKTRIRIKTTTAAPPFGSSTSRTSDILTPIASELSTRTTDLKTEATASKFADRLAILYPKAEIDNTTRVNGTYNVIVPKNILRRRRPTTTTTTTSTTTSTPFYTYYYSTETQKPVQLPVTSTIFPTTTIQAEETTETIQPIIVTSRTSSESSSKPILNPKSSNGTLVNQNRTVNISLKDEDLLTEKVDIEEKTYTASYVLAGLGFLPVAGIIAFVLRNVWSKKVKVIDTDYEGYFDPGDVKKESPITPVARTPILPPPKTDQKWEFPRNKLRLQTLLGQGNFGQVWKAEADDLTGHDGMTRLVAVKSIKETASQKEKQELLHEIYIMQKIGTHPNVVTLLACCTGQEPYLLIMEYVMCGKLLTYLRERRSRPDRFSGSGALTSRDLTVFAYCVARGMDYIASKGIVHRDLAARNVLVDHNKLCKIADFGMSREVCGNEDKAKQRHALPVRWMAPEALLYNVYNHETDVWAYGILLWEIVTLGSTPYAAMSGREVLSAVTEGYRLERPPHCKPQLYTAMHSCWHADPSQRPTFAALKSQLADLLDNEPVEGNYVDLDSFYQESSVYSDPSAIIHDDEGLSAEYDRERRCFRELAPGPGPAKYDNRAFNYRDEDLRSKFGIGTPRMGGFGIRDVPFNDRNFSDGDFNERPFSDKNFNDRNFTDANFNERKEGKLSTSSFHRERERERDNPLVSRNSFNGFPRVTSRDAHFQILNDGRNKRVPEFECDI